MIKLFFAAALLINCGLLLAQSNGSSAGVPVQMIVTVEALHGKDVPLLNREDVVVHQGQNRLRVTDWVPVQGEHAGVDLFVLVDEACGTRLGAYLDDLRQFINSQPATTRIGIGYTSNHVDIRQRLTADRVQASKALRIPMGIIGGSPYASLSDLIKQWPADHQNREVLMVSDGNDPLGGWALSSPYVDAAIENAQRAGIVVYSIYFPAVGHSGHSPWRMFQGQNYLAKLSEDTGGESYNLSTAPPVSFAPYTESIVEQLTHQYLVTFLAKAGPKAGFQSVKLTTEVPNAELVAATKIYVPGAQSQASGTPK
jgi:hypothetical protein